MELINDFAVSTEASLEGLPHPDTLLPPANGITLLDAKNEIFLSYLQGLALRNLNIIRSIKDGKSVESIQEFSDQVTRKLVEHRVYLERGVRPLEHRIRYQADKVVRAAIDEETRAKNQNQLQSKTINGHKERQSESDKGDSDDSGDDADDAEIDELSYRPNPSAFNRPEDKVQDTAQRTRDKDDGIYRPPRISATAMPDLDQRERRERRPNRSATMDEYVNTEMSTAPVAEPSVGSTIIAGGRQTKSARVLAEEAERREYEETNLVRLPSQSKKDKRNQGRNRGTFGGEEWRGLGENLSRISDLTKRKSKESVLDKSRKRRAVEDGPRGDGMGQAFDVKRKRFEKKQRR